MTIKKKKDGSSMIISVSGQMDTVTAPELDAVVDNELDGITDLTLDFDGLTYSSSAGLRVILKAQKKMNRQGKMKVINVSREVMELLGVPGFVDFLTIVPA